MPHGQKFKRFSQDYQGFRDSEIKRDRAETFVTLEQMQVTPNQKLKEYFADPENTDFFQNAQA